MRLAATLITAPPTAPRQALSFNESVWEAWDVARPDERIRVVELNAYRASRAAAIELRVPQDRVRVWRAVELSDRLPSLGVA